MRNGSKKHNSTAQQSYRRSVHQLALQLKNVAANVALDAEHVARRVVQVVEHELQLRVGGTPVAATADRRVTQRHHHSRSHLLIDYILDGEAVGDEATHGFLWNETFLRLCSRRQLVRKHEHQDNSTR